MNLKKTLLKIGAIATAVTTLLTASPQQSEAIIGGVSVNQPAAARIIIGNMACTGTLISPEWLITAKHCIAGTTGTVSLGNFRWGETHGISDIIVHNTADLALIKLDQPTAVPPVAINTTHIAPGTQGDVIGWGGTYQFQFVFLKGAHITVNRRVTNVATGTDTYDNSSSFLELYVNNARITYGDSGGPLLVGGQLAAVASMANEGANPSVQGLLGWYIPVAEYLPWISAVTGLNLGAAQGIPAPLVDSREYPPTVIGRLPSTGISAIDSIINNGITAFSS